MLWSSCSSLHWIGVSLTSEGTEVSFIRRRHHQLQSLFLWEQTGGQWVPARSSATNLYVLTHCSLCTEAWQRCFSTTSEEWTQSTCAIKDETPTLVVKSSSRPPQLDLMCSPSDVLGCPQTDWREQVPPSGSQHKDDVSLFMNSSRVWTKPTGLSDLKVLNWDLSDIFFLLFLNPSWRQMGNPNKGSSN